MPSNTIPIKKKTFENIVTKSGRWDDTVKYLEIGKDPLVTSFEDVQRVIGGFKSRGTDLQTKLTKAEVEVKNKKEQVGRLKEQLLSLQKLHKDEYTKLNSARKSHEEAKKLYERSHERLQGQVDTLAKEKGGLKIELATKQNEIDELKAKLKDVLKNKATELTLYDVGILVFNWLLRRSKQIKIEEKKVSNIVLTKKEPILEGLESPPEEESR